MLHDTVSFTQFLIILPCLQHAVLSVSIRVFAAIAWLSHNDNQNHQANANTRIMCGCMFAAECIIQFRSSQALHDCIYDALLGLHNFFAGELWGSCPLLFPGEAGISPALPEPLSFVSFNITFSSPDPRLLSAPATRKQVSCSTQVQGLEVRRSSLLMKHRGTT